VHFGRGVGCGLVHGLEALTSNGRHSEFGHIRARIGALERGALMLSETEILSNCEHHGGEDDNYEGDKTPCFDGLLARSTLDRLPRSINRYNHFTTYSAHLIATIALTEIPDMMFIGGSSLSRLGKSVDQAFQDILRIFDREVSGFPAFSRKTEDKSDRYIRLSDWSNPTKSMGHETAAQKGAAILGWRKLDEFLAR
jgi:predicted NBD/HSP70 family sugar kinase